MYNQDFILINLAQECKSCQHIYKISPPYYIQIYVEMNYSLIKDFKSSFFLYLIIFFGFVTLENINSSALVRVLRRALKE